VLETRSPRLAARGVRTMITVGFNCAADSNFHGPGRGVNFPARS
jgi:hypothetical protein